MPPTLELPHPQIQLPHRRRIDLHHLPVIRHQPIQLILHVRQLRINRGDQPQLYRRGNLLPVQPPQPGAELLPGRQPFIAEILLVIRMSGNTQVISAELAQRSRTPAPVRLKTNRLKINVPA